MKNKKVRIGLLTQADTLPAWSHNMLSQLIDMDCSEIVLVVRKECDVKPKLSFIKTLFKEPKYFLFKLFKKWDERKSVLNPSAFIHKPLKDLVQCDVLNITTKRTKFSDWVLDGDLETIKSYDLDLMIRLGFNILRGDILNVAKFGVWSYHHGDNKINRGGPAGTWEVLKKWDETGALLQILTEDLDGGIHLDSCSIQTQKRSLIQNKNMLYWKANGMLPLKVLELYRIGDEEFRDKLNKSSKGPTFYDKPLYKMPTNSQILPVLWDRISSKVKGKLHKKIYFNQWVILFEIKKHQNYSGSFFRFKRLLPPKDRIWADPFVIERDDKFYIFLEELILGKKKQGHISVLELNKKGEYLNPVKVICENWHLSYPHLIEVNNELFMVPESNDNRTIDLYKCLNFPYKWEKVMTLMNDVVASDTTIHFKDGKYWMFTAMPSKNGTSTLDELYLFYSDTLMTTNWVSHPMNPIVKEVRYARQAGALFEHNGSLYRPAQNNAGHYGASMNIQQVLQLDEERYEEKNIGHITPDWSKDLISTHTINFQDKITVIDALIKRKR